MTCNTITKNFVLEDLVYNAVSAAEASIDMTDCKGEIDLLLDATAASADATVTVCGGDYVGKADDADYVVPKGTCKRISISSAEVMKTDGCVHLAFASYTGLKVAVLKRRYVTNH